MVIAQPDEEPHPVPDAREVQFTMGLGEGGRQSQGGTAKTKQASVNSAVIETRTLTASRIDWPGSGCRGSRSTASSGRNLSGCGPPAAIRL